MTQVLLATDADWLAEQVFAAIGEPGTTISRIKEGRDITKAAIQVKPDLVLLDMQIGTKGGIASCIDLRADQDMDRVQDCKIMMLLDRDDDRWLARTAGADGWLIKPLSAFTMARAIRQVLAGENYFEGEADTSVAAANAG